MAKQCLEKAATGQERQKSGWHAAKNMEKAGGCCLHLAGSSVVIVNIK